MLKHVGGSRAPKTRMDHLDVMFQFRSRFPIVDNCTVQIQDNHSTFEIIMECSIKYE